jgi:hypothetical protein
MRSGQDPSSGKSQFRKTLYVAGPVFKNVHAEQPWSQLGQKMTTKHLTELAHSPNILYGSLKIDP